MSHAATSCDATLDGLDEALRKGIYTSVDINPVLDPMGVGDAFIAAYLHAHFRWRGKHQKHLDYALTASAMKNTIVGDFNLLTEQEVLETMEVVLGDTSSHIPIKTYT